MGAMVEVLTVEADRLSDAQEELDKKLDPFYGS
jgi:hypothetical protein